MKKLLASMLAGILPLPALAQTQTHVAPGHPVTIHVAPAATAAPDVSITLGARHGHVTPNRCGCVHTGGGNIDIQQPSSDTVVVTMTGVAVATGSPLKDSLASLSFELEQCLEIAIDNPKVKKAKLTIDGRVIGVLRSNCKGKDAAEQGKACAAIGCNGVEVVTLCVPPHSVGCGENLSINCTEGPVTVPVLAGKYVLHQTFCITASHAKGLGKASSAEFADGALDPLWISAKEPFYGVAKKDFGFQITIKVAADDSDDKPAVEKIPAPAADGAAPLPKIDAKPGL